MLEALQSSAESVASSAESKPYVAIFSPLEHSPQDVQLPVLSLQSESDSNGNPHSPISTAGQANSGTRRKRRAWAPDGDDHLIYRRVQLEGKGQGWTAQCFGISQSTVSRIVQRYERWQAHAEARDDGRLDPAERLRAQRWLAFERNEQMLASCLRLAADMEGFQDISRTVKSNPVSSPSAESTLRTEWSVMDRTGMAARFLRLAFRINLEQLKLAEATPAPLPEPLSEEEVAEQAAQAALDRAEIVAVRERANQEINATQASLLDQLAAAQQELAEARREAILARAELESRFLTPSGTSSGVEADLASDPDRRSEVDCDAAPSRREGATVRVGATVHNLHNLHAGIEPKTGASVVPDETCVAAATAKKTFELCLHKPPQGLVTGSGRASCAAES
jgi:hypothetical protein